MYGLIYPYYLNCSHVFFLNGATWNLTTLMGPCQSVALWCRHGDAMSCKRGWNGKKRASTWPGHPQDLNAGAVAADSDIFRLPPTPRRERERALPSPSFFRIHEFPQCIHVSVPITIISAWLHPRFSSDNLKEHLLRSRVFSTFYPLLAFLFSIIELSLSKKLRSCRRTISSR
jgi:hypothetical protein